MGVSFKWHGPGGCCCEVQGYYDWYRDEDDTAGTTTFVRVPSVLYESWMECGPGITDSSIAVWTITSDDTKTIMLSCAAGFQATESGSSETVWTEEDRGETNTYLALYDCLSKTILDSISYTADYDGYAGTVPSITPSMNAGYTEDTGSEPLAEITGYGVAFNSITRGLLEMEWGDPLDEEGILAEWTYSEVTGYISLSDDTFDRTELETPVQTVMDSGEGPPSWYLWEDDYGPVPQSLAPRYWPYCAWVKHHYYSTNYLGNPDDLFVTVYPKAEVFTGTVSVSSGSLVMGSSTLIATYGGSGIYGCWSNLIPLDDAWQADVDAYDHSPGGSVMIVNIREKTYDGDLTDPDANITYDYAYYVKLYVNTNLIESYETDDTWASPYAEMLHAVHKHPTADSEWLFIIVRKDISTETYFHLRCYDASGNLEWTSPYSTDTAVPPRALWSSDRWIYVENLDLSQSDVYDVTDGAWNEAHDQWLISHNGSKWVPAGTRQIAGTISPFPVSDGTLRYDTIKNSRLLPYVPPASVF